MIARKTTEEQLIKALGEVNKLYDNNVIFDRLEFPNFTLRVKDSKGKGARRGFHNRKRLINACWHVHSDFFDCLFKINTDSYIWSGGKKITIEGGNWIDRNIGSIMKPLLYSKACECN